jgi:GntR family transcriptional regulator
VALKTLQPKAQPAAKPAHATIDLNQSTVSRYIQLATLFRRRIETGVWAAGAQIPTVDDLAAEYGVARATIRQALDQVEAEGLIERFRAKGTFVRHRADKRLWCEVKTDWSGLLRSRPGATIEILGIDAERNPPSLAEMPGTPAPSYRHFRRRHWRDGQAFLLADVYLDERLWPLVTAKNLAELTALNLVASLPGVEVAEVRQTLTIGTADVEIAGHLNLPLNAPVAFVDRSAVDVSGTLILVAAGVYRGDVVRIDVMLNEAPKLTTG